MKSAFPFLMLSILSTSGFSGINWRGFNYDGESGWIDMDSRLGWISISTDPWIYSLATRCWFYLPVSENPRQAFWGYWLRGSPGETFDTADRPQVTLDPIDNYKLLRPWNYDKERNATRKYPLIVSLHGGTSSTDTFYMPCIVGDDDEMQQYPCFFFAPNSPSGWGGSSAIKVISIIEKLIDTYRIDENRIYLMGFSMGGSGSYLFANSCYDHNQRLFAGIVRMAGQSQTMVRDAIAERTSIWYHIGLNDVPVRVDIARQAYQLIKDYPSNSAAIESTFTDTLGEFPRTTRTLTLDGTEIMKLSEYEGMGHEGWTPFKDPALLKWLFAQSLKKR